MCAYRLKDGENKGSGWAVAAILAATLLGLILVGFAGPGRASDEMSAIVVDDGRSFSVWEDSSFQVEVSSAGN